MIKTLSSYEVCTLHSNNTLRLFKLGLNVLIRCSRIDYINLFCAVVSHETWSILITQNAAWATDPDRATVWFYSWNPVLHKGVASDSDVHPFSSVRHGARGCGMARGGEGGVFGPRCCPEVGVGRFLSARKSGATEPVQEERKSEDHFHSHQTEGDDTNHICIHPFSTATSRPSFVSSLWSNRTWRGWAGGWSSSGRPGPSWRRCRTLWREQDWSPIETQRMCALWRGWERCRSTTISSSPPSATCHDFTPVRSPWRTSALYPVMYHFLIFYIRRFSNPQQCNVFPPVIKVEYKKLNCIKETFLNLISRRESFGSVGIGISKLFLTVLLTSKPFGAFPDVQVSSSTGTNEMQTLNWEL